MCKPSLVVPPQYLGLGFHSRGKRGSPLRGDQGEDEGGQSVGCSDRVQQTKGYTVPKTTAQLETVDLEDDVQQAHCEQSHAPTLASQFDALRGTPQYSVINYDSVSSVTPF